MTPTQPPPAGIPFKVETWPVDADGFAPTLCTECGTPVRYGSRHTRCAPGYTPPPAEMEPITIDHLPGTTGDSLEDGMAFVAAEMEQAAGDEPLKPCPFCGETPKVTERPDNIDGTEFFAAVACYCGGYSATAHKMVLAKTQAEATAKATAAWNRRTTPAAAGEMAQPATPEPAENLPTWVLLIRPGMAPQRKGPFYEDKHTEAMLRSLYALHADATCIVIDMPHASFPESGSEWLGMIAAARESESATSPPAATPAPASPAPVLGEGLSDEQIREGYHRSAKIAPQHYPAFDAFTNGAHFGQTPLEAYALKQWMGSVELPPGTGVLAIVTDIERREPPKNCSNALAAERKPYPRTCAECGLGPCRDTEMHTPAPWTYGVRPDGTIWLSLGDPRRPGAEHHQGDFFGTEADARLIAAAPELLHACEQAVVWLEGWASAEPYIGILRAAIARATGSQT